MSATGGPSRTAARSVTRESCDCACALSMRFAFPQHIIGLFYFHFRSMHFNLVILAFPAVFFQPKESESNGCLQLLSHTNIYKVNIKGSRLRPGIGRVLPFVARPM